jgi:hypothetical protein|tara:strand:+ start:205 stop:396 length:192 start_codon:yes stop_codon:yes gene_type:complete
MKPVSPNYRNDLNSLSAELKEIKSLLQDIVEVLSEKYVPINYDYDTTNATINLWDGDEKVQNN